MAFSSRLLCCLCSLALSIAPNTGLAQSIGSGSRTTKAVPARELARQILESCDSLERLLFLYGVAGASAETIRTIGADVRAKLGANLFPVVALKRDQLIVNGKATGIRVANDSNLNIEYRGHVWSFDKSLAPDQNLLSLSRFLQGKKQAGATSPFLSAAYADDRETSVTIAGVAWGIVYAALAAVVAVPVLAGTWLAVPVIALATFIGAYRGSKDARQKVRGLKKRDEETIDRILKNEFTMDCSENEMVISYQSDQIRVSRPETDKPINIVLRSGQEERQIKKPAWDHMRDLSTLQGACHTSEEGVQIVKAFKDALRASEERRLDPGAPTAPKPQKAADQQ